MNAPPPIFGEWCAKAHPDVRLLPWQERWINMLENEEMPVVFLGNRSGKTFITRLWAEYVDATRAEHPARTETT